MNPSAPQKNKKLVVVGHDATRTGAPIFLLHLVNWFKQNSGFEIEILLRNSGPLTEEFRKIAPTRVLHYNRLEMALHRTCQMFGWQTPHWISSAAKLARHLRRSPADLVYANTVAVADEVAAVAPLGLPILWHVHEMPFVIHAYAGGKPFRAASGFAEKFIAVAESVKLGLIENGVPPDKIQVIHGFVPPGKKTGINIPASRAQVRSELNLPADAFVAGMCGTVGWRKGFDWFIAVARQLAAVSPRRDIHLIWIGAPEDETVLSQVNFDLHNARLTERVKFIGARADSRPYLAALDAFLLSSREDSFPLVMLEAASLGLPVVCFAGTGGATEFVGNDAGIVVDNGDVSAAAAALVRLADQPALRQQLGAAGREKVRAVFTLDVQGPKILQVAEELATPKNGSRQ